MPDKSTTKYTDPITESVVNVNQIVLGSAAATAMAAMYVTLAQAAGVGAQNSVTSQNHLNILGNAAIGAGTGNLLWEGLNRQVENLTMNDRLKYWEQMMAISKGQPTEQTPAADTTSQNTSTDTPSA
ncbi:hypothetical protein GUA87_13350 [Sneathiella sp. P13V-1]|uniref:RebB family R body protein n=1 Tax=Sneathiella sp. P13V-1 TaxID=2697366 RepID=UPI00187B8DB9|nr:RebB family R body protein [Sneathiella sp. P13V-1]MBE7637836.1 hypothetical protein [Sneathiella sp. P13V-1]